MKKYFKLLSMLLVVLMSTSFLACSDDKDKDSDGSSPTSEEVNGEDITLPTPKYLNDAAVYIYGETDDHPALGTAFITLGVSYALVQKRQKGFLSARETGRLFIIHKEAVSCLTPCGCSGSGGSQINHLAFTGREN